MVSVHNSARYIFLLVSLSTFNCLLVIMLYSESALRQVIILMDLLNERTSIYHCICIC